jgi:ferritin-like protein
MITILFDVTPCSVAPVPTPWYDIPEWRILVLACSRSLRSDAVTGYLNLLTNTWKLACYRKLSELLTFSLDSGYKN